MTLTDLCTVQPDLAKVIEEEGEQIQVEPKIWLDE
jgi:hypothetical protein